MTMTQNQLKILCLISLGAFIFSVVNIITIVTLTMLLGSYYLYVSKVFQRITQRGLIQLLPQRIQNHLLHRSIFDLICDFWFFEAFRFFKLVSKPLLEPIQQDSVIQALDDVSPSEKNKYLVKGIFKVMPYSFQRILLGKERMQQLKTIQTEPQQQQFPRHLKERDSQKNTDDQSEKSIPRLREIGQNEMVLYREQSQDRLVISQKSVNFKQTKTQIVKNKPKFVTAKKNFFEMIHNSIGMIKNIIQIQSLNGRIQKMSTGTIIKFTILFWIILIAQIKFNKHTRQIVFKTLYILGGIISVFGTVGTTGALIYKLKKQPKPALQAQK